MHICEPGVMQPFHQIINCMIWVSSSVSLVVCGQTRLGCNFIKCHNFTVWRSDWLKSFLWSLRADKSSKSDDPLRHQLHFPTINIPFFLLSCNELYIKTGATKNTGAWAWLASHSTEIRRTGNVLASLQGDWLSFEPIYKESSIIRKP